jgi:hypothetical protein
MALIHDSPIIYLPSIWDYRHEPLCLIYTKFLNEKLVDKNNPSPLGKKKNPVIKFWFLWIPRFII